VADHAAPSKPITIVVADDHTVMRNGLRLLLDAEPDFEVVAETGTVAGVYRDVRAHWPRVLVLDMNMPGGSSLDAIGRVVKMSPRTSIVVLTMQNEPALVRVAFDAGASDYVIKDAAGTELVRAIRAAVGASR
jgi:two-component system response regulator NreC